jgi:integrase
MLIEQRENLKLIQMQMGHEDITTTLNVYGHLIQRAEAGEKTRPGLLSVLGADNSCGKSVANPP